jgi:hypothetical protein
MYSYFRMTIVNNNLTNTFLFSTISELRDLSVSPQKQFWKPTKAWHPSEKLMEVHMSLTEVLPLQ